MYVPGLVAVFGDLQSDGELDGGVLVAHLAGDGVVERALDESGIFKLGEQAQRALLELGIGGGFGDLLQPVEERGIAVAGGDGQGGLAQRGVDGGGIGEILFGDLLGLRQDGGILAVIAEDAEELGAQLACVGRIALRGGRAWRIPGAKVRRIQAAIAACSSGVAATCSKMALTPPRAALDNLRAGVGFDGGHEVEIVAHGGLVGAHLRPLVADQADALGGRQAGFHLATRAA